MIERASSRVRLFMTSTLIASLMASLLCGASRGDDLSAGKSFRVRAAAFAPIGRAYSLGGISINGRAVYGEQMIWDGDLLQAADDASARVLLSSVGHVALERGAMLRLATLVSTAGETTAQVLIVSLLSGNIAVHLEEGVSAYVEACESIFIASSGAKFRVEIRANHAVAALMRGTLTQGLVTRRTYHVRLVKPVLSANQDMVVKKGQTARNEYQVDKSETKEKKGASDLRVSFTRGAESAEVQAAVETPAPSKRVQFTLGQNIGELSSSITTTDSQGRARVTFRARRLGDADLTATVIDLKHTEDEIEDVIPKIVHIRVVKGVFWTKKKLLITAAGIGGVVCIFACSPKTRPLRQEPPPIIP